MIKNKRAKFDYFILETEVAGMVLMGSVAQGHRKRPACKQMKCRQACHWVIEVRMSVGQV